MAAAAVDGGLLTVTRSKGKRGLYRHAVGVGCARLLAVFVLLAWAAQGVAAGGGRPCTIGHFMYRTEVASEPSTNCVSRWSWPDGEACVLGQICTAAATMTHTVNYWICRDGEFAWDARFENASDYLCKNFADVRCLYSNTSNSLVCDRCALGGNTLVGLPRTWPGNLRSLAVRCHTVIELDADRFDTLAYTLESLEITHSNVDSLAGTPFGHLPRLTTLNLSHNFIRNVANEDMPRLQRLVTLDLSSNQIATMGPLAMRAALSTSCSAATPVRLLMAGNPCQCRLTQQLGFCNYVDCDCWAAPRFIRCGSYLNLPGSDELFPEPGYCDGVPAATGGGC
jgi:hypothetical protein